MKKLKVYIDTSVIGGCFDEEFLECSNKLMNEIISGEKIGVISDITIREIEKAPDFVKNYFETIINKLEILEETEEVANLAKAYMKEKILGEKFFNDALHVAFASANQIDVLVSWNFKHIVNYNKINLFNAINLKNGYPTLHIYSPMEVINNEQE